MKGAKAMSGKDSNEKDSKRLEMLEAEIAKADEEIRRRQEAVSEKRAEARRIRARLKYAERKNQAAVLRDSCAEKDAEIERLREEITALKNSTSVQNRGSAAGIANAEITADDSLTEGQKTIEMLAARAAAERHSENPLAPDKREPYMQESDDAIGPLF